MSSNFKMGQPVNASVIKKIKALQSAFGDTGDNSARQNYIDLQQSTPWIRMQSGVNLTEGKAKLYGASAGYDLAKKNILFGANFRNDSGKYTPDNYSFSKLPGYDDTSVNFGTRPRPGITGMNIHSHNRFGSLRTAMVKFQCWSKEQIDALEVLYMRPGYTVLLEWGHSKVLRFDGEAPTGVDDIDLGINLYESGLNTASALRNRIIEKRKTNAFSYDAIVGTIKNFSWTLRSDGGYDCTTSLVTSGDLLESYKANFFLDQREVNTVLNEEVQEVIDLTGEEGLRFPELFYDKAETPPQIGPNLTNLITSFAQQTDKAIKLAADYIEQDFLASTSDLSTLVEKTRNIIVGVKPDGNRGSANSADGVYVDTDYITTANITRYIKWIASALRQLEVVKPKDSKHSFQGQQWEMKQWSPDLTGGISGYNTRTCARYGNIHLVNGWDYLVDLFVVDINSSVPNGDVNGFGNANATPDINLPGGGRIALQIPYAYRRSILDEYEEVLSDAGKSRRIAWKGDAAPIFVFYAILGNVLQAIGEEPEYLSKIPGTRRTGNVWSFWNKNPGGMATTGITGLTADQENGSYVDARKKLYREWFNANAPRVYSSDGSDCTDANRVADENWPEQYGEFRKRKLPYQQQINTLVASATLPDPYKNLRMIDVNDFDEYKEVNPGNLYFNPQGGFPGWDSSQSASPTAAIQTMLPSNIAENDDDDVSFSQWSTSIDTINRVHGEKIVINGPLGTYTQWLVKYKSNPKIVTQPTAELGITRFMVAHFKGYDPSTALEGQIVTGAGETGGTYTFYDPNDDYVSKLHYYLRVNLEATYVTEYLSQDFTGQLFEETFKYRPLPKYNDALASLYKDTGPSLRTSSPGSIKSRLVNLLGGRFASEQELELRNHVYITLGCLLEIINRHVLRSDSEYFFTFQTEYSDSAPAYFTFDDHISADPRVCILPHTITKLIKSPSPDCDGKPTILNIELSLNFILDTLNKYISSGGRAAILEFIQDILDSIGRVSGGQNDLQLQYFEDTSTFHVVDRRAISRNKYAALVKNSQINIYGLDSVVNSFNLVSKLTPQISSMIAISAQDNPYTAQDEATGFNGINRGVTDRLYTTRYEIEKKETENAAAASYEDLRRELKERIVGVLTHLGMFYSKALVPRYSVDTQIGAYENYCKFLFGADTKFNQGGRTSYNFIIPFELQLKMYGISGINVMDTFVINKELLPSTYGGDEEAPVGFLVTGVEHDVTKQGWTTNIKTQIYNIDDKNEKTNFIDLQDDFVEAVRHIQAEGSSGGSNWTGGGQGVWTGNEEQFTDRVPKSITLHVTSDNHTAQQTVDYVGRKSNTEYNNGGIHWAVDRTGATVAGIPETKRSIHGNNWNTSGIGIEIVLFGYVTPNGDGTAKSNLGTTVPAGEWVDLGYTYRGHRYYQEYTDTQISALKTLINGITGRYPIIKTGMKDSVWDIWGMTKPRPGDVITISNQLIGTQIRKQTWSQPGIFAHATGKEDAHPDAIPTPKLINMLCTLGYRDI